MKKIIELYNKQITFSKMIGNLVNTMAEDSIYTEEKNRKYGDDANKLIAMYDENRRLLEKEIDSHIDVTEEEIKEAKKALNDFKVDCDYLTDLLMSVANDINVNDTKDMRTRQALISYTGCYTNWYAIMTHMYEGLANKGYWPKPKFNMLWVSDYKNPINEKEIPALIKAAKDWGIPIESDDELNIIVVDRMKIFDKIENNVQYSSEIAKIAIECNCRIIGLNYTVPNNVGEDVMGIYCGLIHIGQMLVVPNMKRVTIKDTTDPEKWGIKFVQRGWKVVENVVPKTYVVE
jgi:hypothetical protein